MVERCLHYVMSRQDENRSSNNKKQHDDYKLVPFPKIRRGLSIMYPSVKRKPMVHGLMEVDETHS